jgi:hypothetical protein
LSQSTTGSARFYFDKSALTGLPLASPAALRTGAGLAARTGKRRRVSGNGRKDGESRGDRWLEQAVVASVTDGGPADKRIRLSRINVTSTLVSQSRIGGGLSASNLNSDMSYMSFDTSVDATVPERACQAEAVLFWVSVDVSAAWGR